VSSGRTWRDDLPSLILATAAQFGLVRAVDWARQNSGRDELAARLVDHSFYYVPQIVAVVVVLLILRLTRDVLNLRRIRLGEWLRSSLLVPFALVLGLSVVVASHLDQLALLASSTAGLWSGEAQALAATPFFGFLRENATTRFAIDVLGLLVCLLALRLGKPVPPDVAMARLLARGGDWVRAGELHLKMGDPKAAKRAFRRGKAWAKLAAIEMREGEARRAAELYRKAGEMFAWEASRAWEAAGEMRAAEEARQAALASARAAARWDRVAEIAEAIGDHASLAEACRRLAESEPTGPVKLALWKRSADAFRTAGRPLEAADAYRNAQEFLLAGELFLEGGRSGEAVREFEKSGAYSRAAVAATAAGNEKAAQELIARDAETRGDVAAAAVAWRNAGQPLRAAGLFEKVGDFGNAAAAWVEAGHLERAAPLYQKAGDVLGAAEAYEASGEWERAATLFVEMKQYEKAATLFRTAGKLPAAAAALQAGGRFEEAASLFQRVGRGLEAARCALLAGHHDQAWDYLMAVPRNEPGIAEVFHELALVHLNAGEPRDAAHVLREFLGRQDVDADNLPLHMTLLKALQASGDSDEGIELGRIAVFDPSVLKGARVAPVPAEELEHHDARMPEALVRTPPATSRSGSRAMPLPRPGVTAPVHAPLPLMLGTSAGFTAPETPETRYEILAELGRGGMGVVHKALDKKLDRLVALKILPWQLRGDETAMRYFKREAKAIAALKHPNIVALYDYGEGFGSLYLAMEFLEGPNLQRLLKTDHERVRKNWRNWFTQATRGVAAAHAKGLLHRDLKPANLILDEHETLRILDFGLALPEADAGGTSKLIGSPAFFPPEVLRGEMPSPASDVYSLGAAFYTLATGRWPYIGDDVLVARLERDPDNPRPYAPFLTEDEIEILMKTLARYRPERYPDGGELLAALLSLEG
jgi:tetratricopeptide (TPR) repeat protein